MKLHVARGGAEDPVEGTDLLVASGRIPNTDGIGLEAAGVERDGRGFVKVDLGPRSREEVAATTANTTSPG